jgi:hypothetical protein
MKLRVLSLLAAMTCASGVEVGQGCTGLSNITEAQLQGFEIQAGGDSCQYAVSSSCPLCRRRSYLDASYRSFSWLQIFQASDTILYQCSVLSFLLPSEVVLSDSPNYRAIPYWSAQQQALTPTCRIDVSSAQDIATTLQVSKLTSCPFAVKSGGHAAFAGGSSIENGILANLNEVKLSADRTTTRVGPGNNWGDVYEVLDSLGVSVVGGRESGVGAGGLTLGGEYFCRPSRI